MSEYSWLCDDIETLSTYTKDEYTKAVLNQAVKAIRKLSADVVPVVRCKDCKHGTRLVCDLAGNEGIECRHGNIAHRLDWFCADGAKTDGEA